MHFVKKLLGNDAEPSGYITFFEPNAAMLFRPIYSMTLSFKGDTMLFISIESRATQLPRITTSAYEAAVLCQKDALSQNLKHQ